MRTNVLILIIVLAFSAACSDDQNPVMTNQSATSSNSLVKQAVERSLTGTLTGLGQTSSSSVIGVIGGWPLLALHASATGSGTFTHLGLSVGTATYDVSWQTPGISQSGTIVGDMTLTAANSDELYLDVSCTYTASSTTYPTTLNVTGSYTITGGTGRFEGATGTGTITGTQLLSSYQEVAHVTTLTFNGKIVY